jgi:hypothetical protein
MNIFWDNFWNNTNNVSKKIDKKLKLKNKKDLDQGVGIRVWTR